MNKNDEPAFPFCQWVGDAHVGHASGLTKREEFAKAAMQGMLANPERAYDFDGAGEDAVKYADALLAALSGGGKE